MAKYGNNNNQQSTGIKSHNKEFSNGRPTDLSAGENPDVVKHSNDEPTRTMGTLIDKESFKDVCEKTAHILMQDKLTFLQLKKLMETKDCEYVFNDEETTTGKNRTLLYLCRLNLMISIPAEETTETNVALQMLSMQ